MEKVKVQSCAANREFGMEPIEGVKSGKWLRIIFVGPRSAVNPPAHWVSKFILP